MKPVRTHASMLSNTNRRRRRVSLQDEEHLDSFSRQIGQITLQPVWAQERASTSQSHAEFSRRFVTKKHLREWNLWRKCFTTSSSTKTLVRQITTGNCLIQMFEIQTDPCWFNGRVITFTQCDPTWVLKLSLLSFEKESRFGRFLSALKSEWWLAGNTSEVIQVLLHRST